MLLLLEVTVGEAPPAPPVPDEGFEIVTTSSVPRPLVARWNDGARSAAIGSNVADAEVTSASVAFGGTTRTIATENVFEATGAGDRVPFVETMSSMVTTRRVAVTVRGADVVSNQGNECPANGPPQSGSVGVVGTIGFVRMPNGVTSDGWPIPIR